MKKEEIESKESIITVFMGGSIKDCYGDWNKIALVLKKIELFNSTIEFNTLSDKKYFFNITLYNEFNFIKKEFENRGSDAMDVVYTTVVDCIDWYNRSQK